jgi:hypothetical protein
VPALNVRSGPGLGFEIVAKVRSTDVEVASVIVTGRTEASDWLRVDETIAPGGWVIAGSEYLTCEGDIALLPAVPESELPPTPTPLPEEELPADGAAPDAQGHVSDPGSAGASPDQTAPAAPPETFAPPVVLPVGTAMINVHNAFDRDMRFTLDQRYRLESGASEYDLLPGTSVSIIVYAGSIPFTASTPWQGLSGNTMISLAEGEVRDLYLTFFYDEADEKWYLAQV